MNKSSLVLFMLALTQPLSQTVLANQLPIESFAVLPKVENPVLSPDGLKVAAKRHRNRNNVLMISDFDDPTIGDFEFHDGLQSIQWANKEMLLGTTAKDLKDPKHPKEYRKRYYRLLVSHKKKGAQRFNDRHFEESGVLSLDNVLSYLPDNKRKVLLQHVDHTDMQTTVYRYDMYNAHLEKLFKNTFGVQTWLADDLGKVVAGFGFDDKQKQMFSQYRQNEISPWQRFNITDEVNLSFFVPVGIKDEQVTVVTRDSKQQMMVKTLDIRSGRWVNTLTSNLPGPMTAWISLNRLEKLSGAVYALPNNRLAVAYLSVKDTKTAQLMTQQLGVEDLILLQRSDDGQRYLASAMGENNLNRYYTWDEKSHTAKLWTNPYPQFNDQNLPTPQPFRFKNSDGQPISGYLTLPNNISKPPRWVVLADEQPSKGYNPWVQMLVNRGFAVVQIQKSATLDNQSTLYKTIKTLQGAGKIAPSKGCIMGKGQGGFVALTVASQRPELFTCLVSISGITDPQALGIPVTNSDKFPINQVKNIQADMLLIHGQYDSQVPVQQSETFFDEAKKYNRSITYEPIRYGTHQFERNSRRIKVFTHVEAFLLEQLKTKL